MWGLDIQGIQRKYPGECVGSGYPRKYPGECGVWISGVYRGSILVSVWGLDIRGIQRKYPGDCGVWMSVYNFPVQYGGSNFDDPLPILHPFFIVDLKIDNVQQKNYLSNYGQPKLREICLLDLHTCYESMTASSIISSV